MIGNVYLAISAVPEGERERRHCNRLQLSKLTAQIRATIKQANDILEVNSVTCNGFSVIDYCSPSTSVMRNADR